MSDVLPEFFVVWNPEGRPPRYRHTTIDAAVAEAKRLAKETPGKEFFVLRSVGVAKALEPVSWTPCDEIPF